MKNYAIIALVTCVAFVTVAARPSHAQVLIKADVPFSFSAGYGVLPAGEYSIAPTGFGQPMLLSNGRRGVELMTPNTTDWREKISAPKLVFHRYGDEYFLAEIWTSADDCVRTLSVHHRERQLAKAGVSPQVAVVYGVLASASGN
jgi:hypothetical protein